MYDYLIKNGLVIDGNGTSAVKADVAVKGDKIARIAPEINEPSVEVYDASPLSSKRQKNNCMTRHLAMGAVFCPCL